MMNSSGDRLDRIEALLERFIDASIADRQTSNERMTRLQQAIERDRKASSEQATRFEQGLEESRQLIHSNNRFLESFSQDLRKYTESMNNLATRNDGIIATANQDSQENNSRLAIIERMVRAIARHLGVTQ